MGEENMKKLFIIIGISVVILQFIKKDNTSDLINNAILNQNLTNQTYNIQALQAEKMITELKEIISINLLEEIGMFTIEHDKTPENNWWSEWLNNSDIILNSKYKVSVTISTQDINLKNINGVIYADLNVNDFYINAIELFETVSVEEKSIFGSHYETSDILALESQMRNQIKESILTDKNIETCKQNIISYLENMANLFNVPIIISVN